MPTISALRSSYEKTIRDTSDKDKNPVHYYDRILREYQQNPAAFDIRLDNAIASGKSKASEFMSKVRDYNNPSHATAVKVYQDKYNADSTKVHDDLVEDSIKASGAKRLEFRNHGYEQSLCNGLVIATPDEQAAVNSLKDLFQKKHAAVGYDGDKKIYDQFVTENLPMRGQISKQVRP
jgi:hypothetical protein